MFREKGKPLEGSKNKEITEVMIESLICHNYLVVYVILQILLCM